MQKNQKVKVNTYIKYFFYYLGLVLCAFLVSYYFYFTFLRQRALKEIPLVLTDLRLYFLIYICILYLYIIYRLLKPKAPHEILLKFLHFYSKPFVYLDTEIKYKLFKSYYARFFFYIVSVVDNLTYSHRKIIYYCLNIIPRFFLVGCFIVDIFYFHKIEIFYYFIFIGLFPGIYTYSMYSLNVFFEGYLKYLEDFYDDVRISEEGNDFPAYWETWPHKSMQEVEEYAQIHSPKAIYHDKTVTLREYIKIQFEAFQAWDDLDKDTHYYYEGFVYVKEHICKQYKEKKRKLHLETSDYVNLKADFNLYMPALVKLYCFIELNKLTLAQTFIRNLNIIIYLLYFSSWVYLVYISYITVTDFTTTLDLLALLSFYDTIAEPFSSLIITSYL